MTKTDLAFLRASHERYETRLPLRRLRLLKLEKKEGEQHVTLERVLLGECSGCSGQALVLRREGLMVCPHCGDAMRWTYQRVDMTFKPEGPSFTGDANLGQYLQGIREQVMRKDRGGNGEHD